MDGVEIKKLSRRKTKEDRGRFAVPLRNELSKNFHKNYEWSNSKFKPLNLVISDTEEE